MCAVPSYVCSGGPDDLSEYDPHTLGGAVKAFLRELDEPVIPENMYKSFLESAGKQCIPFLPEVLTQAQV